MGKSKKSAETHKVKVSVSAREYVAKTKYRIEVRGSAGGDYIEVGNQINSFLCGLTGETPEHDIGDYLGIDVWLTEEQSMRLDQYIAEWLAQMAVRVKPPRKVK